MGLPTQSLAGTRVVLYGRRGIALPSAMFALVAASILVAGVFAFADLSAKATLNQERATRAMHVAEAGMAHTLGLLRGPLRGYTFSRILKGSDNLFGTAAQRADDSLMIGTAAFPAYALAAGDQIPLAGKTFAGGTYFVSVMDDSADTDLNPNADMNGRIRVRCRAVMADGAAAEVNAIVGSIPMPGVVTDGNLEISGKLKVQGACGSMHTNGNITGGGQPTVSDGASATGNVGPGTLIPQSEGVATMNVPDLNAADYWGTCDHHHAGNLSITSGMADGTHCVTGNLTGSSDFGSMTNMKAVSFIVKGYIKISAKPFIRAAHPDGILFLTDGDLDLQGDWGGEGAIYAEGHCYISSKPVINGTLICKSKPGAPGPVSANLISGDAIINFDCSTNSFNKRRVLYWYPRIGA